MNQSVAAALLAAAITPLASAIPSKANPFDTIDTSSSTTGVVSIASGSTNAANVHSAIRGAGFTQYTHLLAPNGKPIHIVGQAGVSEAQMRRARSILSFYLTSVGNTYGPSQKAAVANAMANRNATLTYTSVTGGLDQLSDAQQNAIMGLNLKIQDLGGDESPTVGSAAWLGNTTRDASYEEIFHLVHDQGIRPALPAYQTQIATALANARPNRNNPNAAANGGQGNLWTITPAFYDELAAEDSLTQEYIISAIDVHYGLWAHDANNPNGSFNGEYKPTTPDNLGTLDPLGLAAVRAFLPETLNYTEFVDDSFTGTFSLALDANQAYTLKSQYLRDVVLTGSNHSNLTGNDLNNLLGGNAGNNTLDGGDGIDTALFSGTFASYTLANNGGVFTVTGADGTDTLVNIEFARFADQTVAIPEPGSLALLTLGGLALLRRRR